MLEEYREHLPKQVTALRLKLHIATMDEDMGGVQEPTKESGSNCLELQGGTAGEVLTKSFSHHPLHRAAAHRKVQSLQTLLSAGADTEMRDHQGRTALHLVLTGWPRDAAAGAEPTSKFQTAVINMCQQAETCLQLLCDHGANVNAKMVEGNCHQTALHLSVRCRALPAVHILASYGADVDAVDSCGMTPLHRAAAMLHDDIMISLIRHGAHVNKGTEHTENTPLHLAAAAVTMKATKTDNISCISELLERGAEPNRLNKAGLTPLHEAFSMGAAEELVDALLERGADVDKRSGAGESCLFLFLDHRPDVRNGPLLVKLLGLSFPLAVRDRNGRLPSALTRPRFSRQRDRLLELARRPWRLQDICKRDIYRRHVQGRRGHLRGVLPERLYNFVFNQWENIHNISFEDPCEQESLDGLFNMSLT